MFGCQDFDIGFDILMKYNRIFVREFHGDFLSARWQSWIC